MKAEKFLEQLGLSVNIVIVILLLVIVYYLYCINDNLSLERFSIGGTDSQSVATLLETVNYKTRRQDMMRRAEQSRAISARNKRMAVEGRIMGKMLNGIQTTYSPQGAYTKTTNMTVSDSGLGQGSVGGQ